jgi:hypothetical protein
MLHQLLRNIEMLTTFTDRMIAQPVENRLDGFESLRSCNYVVELCMKGNALKLCEIGQGKRLVGGGEQAHSHHRQATSYT